MMILKIPHKDLIYAVMTCIYKTKSGWNSYKREVMFQEEYL
jgi:hypothetical protein